MNGNDFLAAIDNPDEKVCLSMCLSICLSACLSICLYTFLSVCLFVCLFAEIWNYLLVIILFKMFRQKFGSYQVLSTPYIQSAPILIKLFYGLM
jgi:hypothetical protein